MQNQPLAARDRPRDPARSARELAVLGCALALGILADLLLRASSLGLGALLWTALLAAGALALLRRWPPPSVGVRLLLGVAVVAAALFAGRDAPTLKALAFLLILAALGLTALYRLDRPLPWAGLLDMVAAGVVVGLDALARPVALLFDDTPWRATGRAGWPRALLPVLRGLAVAVPLLLLFGALLASADAVFGDLLGGLFAWGPEDIIDHLLVSLIAAWPVAGFLRGLLDRRAPSLASARPAPRAGIVETGVVLGLIDLLFLAFVAVQFRYFFGGDLVQERTGLTYAEYARRGFFELVAVVALVLPILLAAHAVLRLSRRREELVFRALAGVQVALLCVIMLSAAQRMRLYQREFGLTELRFFTSAFMIWLAVVLVIFVLTVLRGDRRPFATAALVSAFVAGFVLHAVNPDGVIVRVNGGRVAVGRSFDPYYPSGLSADAAPALIDVLPRLAPEDRCPVARSLLGKWSDGGEDWRTWSLSRAAARRAVRDHRAMLEAACADGGRGPHVAAEPMGFRTPGQHRWQFRPLLRGRVSVTIVASRMWGRQRRPPA